MTVRRSLPRSRARAGGSAGNARRPGGHLDRAARHRYRDAEEQRVRPFRVKRAAAAGDNRRRPGQLHHPRRRPAALTDTQPGRERLQRLCDGFLDYVEQRVFPGGCFFVTTSAEMGGRHGPVRDRVAAYRRQWRDLLMQAAHDAHAAADVPPDTDPDQLAFELGAILAGANLSAVLHDDNTIIDRAREAIRARVFT